MFAFSLQLSVLGKWSFFCARSVTKHYKNRGFHGHRGKLKWHFWFQSAILGFTICDTPKLCSAENTIEFFFFVCFVLFVWKKPKEGYFPAILEFFVFCVPKRSLFQILLFFLFCCVSLFSFCPPFQNSILFLLLLSINTCLEHIIILVSSVFLFLLPLPLFMFACFFQTNFPNMPF